MQRRETKLVDQIVSASQSSSLYVRQQYKDMVTTNDTGRHSISTQGQAFIEKQLAQMAQEQKGVFSQENLSGIAERVGFKPGAGQSLLSAALSNQGAIAFVVTSLPAISPLILVLGGVAFVAAAILANFLGIRTVLKGVLQVGIGTGQVLVATFRGVVDIVSSLGVVARGILRALHGDFTFLDLIR